jgi:hypothetical protein
LAAGACLARPVFVGSRPGRKNHPQKITFGEMRESGVRGVLVHCADYRCSHSIAICQKA